MQDFKGLKVWQKAHELTLAVDKAAAKFPTYRRIVGGVTDVKRMLTSFIQRLNAGC
jgi:hypothetical protein